MIRISIHDLIPPIIPKAIRYINRSKGMANYHPFDQVPKSIKARLILDVGANVGDVTVAALKSYPECHVICFEPVNSTFNILEKRLKPYAHRVTVYNEALSSISGNTEINITSFHGANSLSPQSSMHSALNPQVREIGKETISMVRLDDIARSFPNKTIDIMKIDVEGHELDVIVGGKSFIQNNVDTIIVEASLMRDLSWDDNQSILEVFQLLSEMGFRLINVYDLHYAKNSSLMCVQMDCVFRHKSKLS